MAKQTYAQRIASGMAKAFAEHPGISEAEARRYARGHGRTGEHGVTITAVGADIVVSFRDPGKLDQAMRAAEKYGGRASVTVVGKNGENVTLFQNKGHLPGRTLDSIKTLADTAGGSLFDGLAASGGAGDGSGGSDDDLDAIEDGEDGVYEYQLIVH